MHEHALSKSLRCAEHGLQDLNAALSGRSAGYLIGRYFSGDKEAANSYLRGRLDIIEPAAATLRRELLCHLHWDKRTLPPASKVDDYYPLLISPFLDLARTWFRSTAKPLLNEQDYSIWRRPLERDVAKRLNQLFTSAIVLEQQDPACAKRADFFVYFFEQYPMLLRYALAVVAHASSDLSILRERLNEDAGALRATFGAETLVHVGDSLGDPHAGGATVRPLEFSHQTIVYKPRTIFGEALLARALRWLGAQSPELVGHVMRCLPRETYGYEEFVAHSPLQRDETPDRFYLRAGATLFMTWLLGVTDLHYENIIAFGDNPVVVDAEAFLWRPFLRGKTLSELALRDHALHAALLLNGLLPSRTKMASKSVSLGGLAGADSIGRPFLVQKLEHSNDGARLVEASMGPETRMGNLPVKDNVQAPPKDYTSDLIEGFSRARAVAIASGEAFAAGVLNDQTREYQRVILRETSFYARLLTALSHPSIASQPRESEALLGQLYLASERRAQDARVAACEANALLDRDIPYFSAPEQDLDLFAGRKRVGQWFDQTGSDGFASRMKHAQALASAHERVIRICVEGEEAGAQALWDAAPPGTDFAKWTRFIANALDERRLAECGGDFWLTLAADADRTLSVAPTDLSLYAGSGGIALFLAAAESSRHAALLTRLEERMANELARPSMRSYGALDGLFGVHYCRLLIRSLKEEAWAALPSDLADYFVGSLAEDLQLDWVSGAAGILRVSAELYARDRDQNAKRVAVAAAKRLFDTANIRPGAVSWTPSTVQQELCGFAHGAAGIAYALTWYAAACDDDDAFNIADAAFAFVHSQWRAEGTFRNAQGQNAGVSWCHGALGVYLAAQRALKLRALPNASLARADALSLLSHAAQYASHDLCHGAIGSTEFQLANGDLSGARKALSGYLDDLRAGAFQTPFLLDDGLFAGITGLGYQCVRVIRPQKIPCLLTLDLPHSM